MNKQIFKKAFADTFPVMAGYLVLGMGFGLLMRSSGFSVFHTLAMSVLIYAGSMQYAAVGLLTGGASLLTVAMTTLAVNARHLFYGISMVDKYRGLGARKPYMIFALTDETYSLVSTTSQGKDYCFWVSLLDHIYWVAGGLLGALVGELLRFNTTGIDFALTALFISIFTEQFLSSKEHYSAFVGVGASVACLLIFGKDNFLIPAMLIIALLLLLRMRKGEQNE